ncbi:YfhO family protein [Agromyces bracchium]|uniref:YfhO family protein n=1 Tax=Agromyces bracchium TaxID=88376 RepID=A0A6I3M7E8_9MICO|nr:YfhO family protein [Agromyces bracchium]MTH68901.1 YfhO family protein [Agromyces bracchium]
MSTATPSNRRPATGRRALLNRLAAVRWDLIASWGSLVAFTVLSIGLPLIGVGTFLGTQLLAWLPPWQSDLADPTPLTNRLIGDTIDSMAPQTMLLVDSVRSGVFPEWNPYVAGGAELAGLPNSGAYSPLSLPWWLLPASYAAAVVKLLEIALVTLGMSLFLRRLRVRQVAWPLASIVFVSSGFMIAWTNWPQTRVAAFIPLLFWALERAVAEARARDIVPVGIAVAGLMLGGFPAIAGYALYAGAAYVIVRAFVLRRGIREILVSGAVAAGGVLLGLILAAWQLVPFALNALSVIDLSIREQSADSHLPFEDLASGLVPDINGGPTIGTWAGHPVEHLSYFSAVALVLLGTMALFRRRVAVQRGVPIFFAGMLLVAVVLIYVGGPTLALAQELPIFSNNPIGRLRVIVGFSAAVLAAFGLDRVVGPEAPGARIRKSWRSGTGSRVVLVLRLLLPIVLGVGAVVLVLDVLREVPPAQFPLIARQVAAIGLTAIAATVIVVLAYFFRARLLRVLAGIVIPVALVIPATLTAAAWWPKSELDTFYPSSPAHEFLAEELGDSRFATVGQTMLPGSSSSYRMRAVGGHAFMTPEWKDLLLEVDEGALQSATYSTLRPEGIAEYGRSPILDRLAVHYLVADPGLALPGDVEGAAPAGVVAAAGAELESSVRTGPVRGVAFTVQNTIAASETGVDIRVELVDPASGESLAATSTWVPAFSGQRWVALDAEALPDEQQWIARVVLDGADGPVDVAAEADGTLAIDVTRPADDGLRVVHTGDATVLERTDALERVRWADEAVAIADPDERLAAMADGTVGRDAVVIDATQAPPADSGSTAVIDEVDGPDPDRQAFTVEVDGGSGLLVIEDSFRRPGWNVTVDGSTVELLPADHAAGAVALEEGEHEVVLTYSTPGLTAGVWVSVITVTLLVAWAAIGALLARRRGAGDAD